jgi:AraC-like DNA-binding protein
MAFYFSVAFIYLHVIVYIYAALRILRSYRIAIKEKVSSVDKINLDWLSFMLMAIAVVLLISVVSTFLPLTGLGRYFNVFFALAFIPMFLFITIVLWKTLKQPQLFSGVEPASGSEKYLTSGLTADEKESIKEKLAYIMTNQKPYLEPNVTLESLSGRIGIAPRKVSQVINESYRQNFFDYINSYRIDTAQEILSESKDLKLTVLEAMYQSGFNSKSSFNTIFKQKTGMTPTAYKKLRGSGKSKE